MPPFFVRQKKFEKSVSGLQPFRRLRIVLVSKAVRKNAEDKKGASSTVTGAGGVLYGAPIKLPGAGSESSPARCPGLSDI
jgi:hypothetical protein